MTEPTRLTADQLAEWAEQVDYARGYVSDRIASPWANAILAVNDELTTLRTCLVRAREALVRYATPRITTDYTGDEWERIDGPDTAQHALEAIDAALGSKEETSGC